MNKHHDNRHHHLTYYSSIYWFCAYAYRTRHYLPFIVMSKARNWSFSKKLWITFMCGNGHVLGAVLLGAVGIALGIGVQQLEFVEALRGDLAALAFILFGLLYFLWGL
ncbi:MAG: hypothetical protein R6U66_10565 [Bacteroidales bacterium]